MYKIRDSAQPEHVTVYSAQFGGQFFRLSLFQLGNASHGLGAQDVASPVTANLQ